MDFVELNFDCYPEFEFNLNHNLNASTGHESDGRRLKAVECNCFPWGSMSSTIFISRKYTMW